MACGWLSLAAQAVVLPEEKPGLKVLAGTLQKIAGRKGLSMKVGEVPSPSLPTTPKRIWPKTTGWRLSS